MGFAPPARGSFRLPLGMAFGRILWISLCVLLFCGCALPVTRVPSAPLHDLKAEIRHETGDLLEAHVQARNRLYMVGAPLLIKNAPLCFRRALTPGFLVLSDFDTPDALRDTAQERLNLSREAQVLAVFPGTAAFQQGLIKGDIVATLNGKPVRNAADLRARLKKIKAPVDARFGFVRNGRAFEMTLPFVPMCNYPLVYMDGERDINAVTDGKAIYVTQGMMEFVSDDELFAVLGHELAHNIMHHIPKEMVNTVVIKVAGGIVDWFININAKHAMLDAYTKIWSPVFEKEADYVGLYLVARTGGRIEAAAPFWRRMAAAHGIEAVRQDPTVVNTHPTTAERFAVLKQTENEIKTTLKLSKPLMPELESTWNFGARYSWWSDTSEDDDEPDDSDLNH